MTYEHYGGPPPFGLIDVTVPRIVTSVHQIPSTACRSAAPSVAPTADGRKTRQQLKVHLIWQYKKKNSGLLNEIKSIIIMIGVIKFGGKMFSIGFNQ